MEQIIIKYNGKVVTIPNQLTKTECHRCSRPEMVTWKLKGVTQYYCYHEKQHWDYLIDQEAVEYRN